MPDRPLGIADIEYNMHDDPGCWFWCRQHERAENSREDTAELCDQDACGLGFRHSHFDCIRIGPFMTEREANRLAGDHRLRTVVSPLGMKVEK